MTDADREDFARLIAAVHAYYRQDCSAFVLDLWWTTFAAQPLAVVRAALNAHARDPQAGRFCPLVADVLRLVEGRAEDRAALAWTEVLALVSSVGGYRVPTFGDEATAYALSVIGGWSRLCRSSDHELPTLARRFVEAYRVSDQRSKFALLAANEPTLLPNERRAS